MTLYWLARRLRNSLEPPEQPDAASERCSHLVGRTRLATAVNRLSVLLSLARLIGEIRRGSPRPAGRAVRCFWGVCRRCDRRYLARCWLSPQRVPGCVTRLRPLHSSCISPLSHVPTPQITWVTATSRTLSQGATVRSTSIIGTTPRYPSRRQNSVTHRSTA